MKKLLAAVFLFAVCQTAIAQQAAVEGKVEKRDYRKLVEGLVSPNIPIRCDNRDDTFSIPPNYDWKAQEKIEKNRRILFDHYEEALPFLIEGCTDPRYSLTSRWSEDNTYSWCVGEICLEIVAHHVEVFREHIRFHDPHHWHQYDFVPRLGSAIGEQVTDAKKKEIQEWWQEHKGMSLHDFQVAAFDWAIKKRKAEQKAVPSGHEDDAAEAEKETSDDIKGLVAARSKLRRGHKCLPAEKMWPAIVSPDRLDKSYKVVPWTEKGK